MNSQETPLICPETLNDSMWLHQKKIRQLQIIGAAESFLYGGQEVVLPVSAGTTGVSGVTGAAAAGVTGVVFPLSRLFSSTVI